MESMAIEKDCQKLNKVIITGATGFIGYALTKKLSSMQIKVWAVVEIDSDKRNIYRTAKITSHYMTRIIANDLGINYNAAIISNVFGKGEISDRFINLTLRRMLKGLRTSFTEANQLYDFIYIDDAVEMLTLIAKSGNRNKNYYIGNMKPRILREFIYDMRDCVDSSIEVGIGEHKEFVGVSLAYQEIDVKSCYNDFGFVPRYSFKDGIRKTIEWLDGHI